MNLWGIKNEFMKQKHNCQEIVGNQSKNKSLPGLGLCVKEVENTRTHPI